MNEKNYELLGLLEEDKRFWITNLITSLSTIIGLIYLLGTSNIEILSVIYDNISSSSQSGILKVIYELINWPKVNFTAWMTIAFIRIFQLTFVFAGIWLNTLFKEYKVNKNIVIITSLTTLYLVFRYRPNWSIFYLLILVLVVIENIAFFLLLTGRLNELTKYKGEINEDEKRKRLFFIGNGIREFIYFGLIIYILANLEFPPFESFINRLESCMILLLILIIYTRWIKPSYYKLNKILSKIERLNSA